jgi:hypothetical protein
VLPFAWIGVSMTIRRAVDAGWSPWVGLAFFVPIVNYGVMLVLAFVPSRRGEWRREPPPPVVDPELRLALRAVAVSVLLGAPLAAALALGGRYSAALFFGVPFLAGAVAGFLANRPAPRSLSQTVLLVLLSQGVIGGLLMLFAIEGAICLFMALPFSLFVGGMGGLAGREIAMRTAVAIPPRHAGLILLALPAAALLEPPPVPAEREVLTTVTVAAPPESVWRHVVAFADLPPPREWLFRAGIAHPVRARIAGAGVGAVRRCEFSTGAFVEPITAWDEPRRLAFDVVAQPPTMRELSPWPVVHAPHLIRSFRAVRGEFRLTPAPGGHTQLEGRTWYTLELWPATYWRLPAEAILHAIHARVLRQVSRLAEGGA